MDIQFKKTFSTAVKKVNPLISTDYSEIFDKLNRKSKLTKSPITLSQFKAFIKEKYGSQSSISISPTADENNLNLELFPKGDIIEITGKSQYFGVKSAITQCVINVHPEDKIEFRTWAFFMLKGNNFFFGNPHFKTPDNWFQENLNKERLLWIISNKPHSSAFNLNEIVSYDEDGNPLQTFMSMMTDATTRGIDIIESNTITQLINNNIPIIDGNNIIHSPKPKENNTEHWISVYPVRKSRNGNPMILCELVWRGEFTHTISAMGLSDKIEHPTWWLDNNPLQLWRKYDSYVNQLDDESSFRRIIPNVNVTAFIHACCEDKFNNRSGKDIPETIVIENGSHIPICSAYLRDKKSPCMISNCFKCGNHRILSAMDDDRTLGTAYSRSHPLKARHACLFYNIMLDDEIVADINRGFEDGSSVASKNNLVYTIGCGKAEKSAISGKARHSTWNDDFEEMSRRVNARLEASAETGECIIKGSKEYGDLLLEVENEITTERHQTYNPGTPRQEGWEPDSTTWWKSNMVSPLQNYVDSIKFGPTVSIDATEDLEKKQEIFSNFDKDTQYLTPDSFEHYVSVDEPLFDPSVNVTSDLSYAHWLIEAEIYDRKHCDGFCYRRENGSFIFQSGQVAKLGYKLGNIITIYFDSDKKQEIIYDFFPSSKKCGNITIPKISSNYDDVIFTNYYDIPIVT